MSGSEKSRKIAVIFVADVVGYSKHMEKDEDATLKAYDVCEKILKKLLKKYVGSIFNTGGDSALVEFQSAVNAVECAIDFQNEIKERNASDKTDTKLEFRIGINMGDVVQKEGNLLGDGVNIAARLEALAQPNGISISKSVYDLVVPKTKVTFNDLGVQKVKQNTFHAYDILLDPSQKRTLKTQSISNATIFAGIAAALIIAIAGFFMLNREEEVAAVEEMGSSVPSILVMPLKATGLSEDQKSFANGLTESMISVLSSYKAIRVLSSNTSFHAEKLGMTDESIAEEYKVNFLVRGSMQVMENNARLNLQIVDLNKKEVVITKKRDFELSNIFSVQDEVSNSILEDMQIDLGVGSQQGKAWASTFKSLEDFSDFLEWRNELRKYSIEGYNNADRILSELRSRYEPDEGFMNGLEAWQIWLKLLLNLSDDPLIDKKRIDFLINRQVELTPDNPDAYNVRAYLGLTLLDYGCEKATADMATAGDISLTVDTLSIGGMVYFRCGDLDKAIAWRKKAIRLVPNDANWTITGGLSSILFEAGRFEEIYEIVGEKINLEDMDSRILAIYAVLEARQGNVELAKRYHQRSINNGLTRALVRNFSFSDEGLLEMFLSELLEIGYFE
jgi:class 3 adenylate cyclase/TolB-like protein/tetratricopeptide (TPR) repeat protein